MISENMKRKEVSYERYVLFINCLNTRNSGQQSLPLFILIVNTECPPSAPQAEKKREQGKAAARA